MKGVSGRRRPLTIKFPGYVYIRVVYCQEWRKTLDIDDQRGDGGALVGLIRPCVKMADRLVCATRWHITRVERKTWAESLVWAGLRQSGCYHTHKCWLTLANGGAPDSYISS